MRRAKQHLFDYGYTRWLLGRINCTVSYFAACREILKHASGWRDLGRFEKRQIIRVVCFYHWLNRDLFYAVYSAKFYKSYDSREFPQ